MSDIERAESARAATEARDASARRTSRGPVSRAVDAAMTQYLAAQEFQERTRAPERPKAADESAPDGGDEA